jgi:aryl-alcohol dehydrogenase (NADP+)
MQNHYNLCYREEEREMIPLCKEEGIAIIPWSPLARGFLTGKYRRDKEPESVSERYKSDRWLRERFFRPEDWDVLDALLQVASEKGVPPAEVALAWLFEKGVTAPIVGVTKVEHVEQAVESLEVKLTPDDIRRLEEPYKPHPVYGHT